MKPLKLKPSTSLRRVGYFVLFTLFVTAFISSTAKAAPACAAETATPQLPIP